METTKSQQITQKFLSKEKLPSVIMFAVFATLTLIGVLNHELWADEAQAWCIVRDNDISGVLNALRYEGHPFVWYAILYPFAHLGFGCEIISIISWIISCITVGLVLFKSPFGNVFKGMIVFSSGFLFFNTVVSRVYCVLLLLLCLLAMLYPKRKQHPVLFGVLIALLTNCHVSMCGLIAAVGIYMIIDFFKDFKKNSKKQNLLNALGLFIAALGVLTLILVLFFSVSSNPNTNTESWEWGAISTRISKSFTIIGRYLCPYATSALPIHFYVGSIVYTLFIIVFIFLLKHSRAIVTAITFTVWFLFATQIVFTTFLSVRATLYLYTIIFIFWVVKASGYSAKPLKLPLTGNESKLIQNIAKLIMKMDKNYQKVISILLSAICIISMPNGIFTLFADYFYNYSMSKPTSQYIKENLDNDIPIVTQEYFFAEYCAYLPDYQFFCMPYNRFVTYSPLNVNNKDFEKNTKKSYDTLKDYNEFYYMIRGKKPKNGKFTPIYSIELPFVIDNSTADTAKNVYIYKLNSPDDIIKLEKYYFSLPKK